MTEAATHPSAADARDTFTVPAWRRQPHRKPATLPSCTWPSSRRMPRRGAAAAAEGGQGRSGSKGSPKPFVSETVSQAASERSAIERATFVLVEETRRCRRYW